MSCFASIYLTKDIYVFYVEITVHILYLTLQRLMQGARQDDGVLSNDNIDSMPVFFGGECRAETARLGRPPPCGGVWGECQMEATVA